MNVGDALNEGDILLVGYARLPANLAGSPSAFVLEVSVSQDGSCTGCAITPQFPLTQRMLHALLVGRPLSDFEAVAAALEERWRGPLRRCIVAAVRNAAALWEPGARLAEQAASRVSAVGERAG